MSELPEGVRAPQGLSIIYKNGTTIACEAKFLEISDEGVAIFECIAETEIDPKQVLSVHCDVLPAKTGFQFPWAPPERFCAEIEFEDGSIRQYDMWFDREHESTCRAALGRLYERLCRLGRDAGAPGADKRNFNGNLASGKGRDPGPKAVRIVRTWVQ